MKLFNKSKQAKIPARRLQDVQANPTQSTFYQEARDWRYEKYESQQVWLNRALVMIGALLVLLVISFITTASLFPLKEKVPFLYSLNERTGELTQVGEFRAEKFSANWLMTRFFLIRYVINRESYDADNLDRPYQIAWAMSEPKIASDYAAKVSTTNPASPFAVYGKDKFITAHVLSVNKLNDDTADVRFEATLHDKDAGTSKTIEKETIIKWKYTQPKATTKMLDRDPLGFKVTYYRPTQVNLDTNAQTQNPS